VFFIQRVLVQSYAKNIQHLATYRSITDSVVCSRVSRTNIEVKTFFLPSLIIIKEKVLSDDTWQPGTAFTNFTIFLINNPANFLLAPLSGILPLACPLT
jgi:hypothetical protein